MSIEPIFELETAIMLSFSDLHNKYQSSPKTLKLAIALLGLGYILVGWQLSLHHILWFLGIAFSFVIPVVAWVKTPWFGGILGHLPQIFLVSLAISLFITLSAIFPVLPTIVIIPVLTTFLAWQEMAVAQFSRQEIWFVLISVALVGLVFGEWIDYFVLQSIK